MALGPSCAPAAVLIVEDEMMLRMRAVDMVVDAGYTPIEALDADEVAILESRSDIALMCTDIQMPGSMDGLGTCACRASALAVDQDHRGVGAIEPAEHRSSSLQQVFRQTTRSRANDCPDAEHDRPGLTPGVFTSNAAKIARLRQSPPKISAAANS